MRPFLSSVFFLGVTPFAALADALPDPVDQHALTQLVTEDPMQAFLQAFEAGDELTEASFTAKRGVGANIGEGRTFTRFPRADLDGPTEWANHFPLREGGANATSCIACHNAPFANGAGDIALNVVVDPGHTGEPSLYLERNTLPLFALGIPQRLAEEISLDLNTQRLAAEAQACTEGEATATLAAKGVDYGSLRVIRVQDEPCEVIVDGSGLDGIDADLVIRPFGWKGNHATIRAFTRDAAHNELGMQAVELVGAEDGDFDGITHELTVGDMTALTVYMAALERPVTLVELADIGLAELTEEERADIEAGEGYFAEAECASCHTPSMPISDPIFREPSPVPGYYDVTFPDGSNPMERGLLATASVSFDLTADQPNNQFEGPDGDLRLMGAVQRNEQGVATAHWFTDFKRHDMGAGLADPDDPLGLGANMFLTRSLAGVGVTGPWLHDGRATTLLDAIMLHGGDATDSVNRFIAMPGDAQAQIIAFLENQVIYVSEEDD